MTGARVQSLEALDTLTALVPHAQKISPVFKTIKQSANDLDALKVERDENDQRKEPTVSEKVALAQAIAERERENAKHRQGKRTDLEPPGNISGMSGDVRDVLAQKVGLGSGKTLEAAQKVVERDIPELVEAMDRGTLELCQLCQICRL